MLAWKKENINMKEHEMLSVLESAITGLGIRLDYEDLRKGEVNTDGGICVLNGEKRALIHKGLVTEDKIDVLLKILANMDTEAIHLPPAVRKRLESLKEHAA